MTMTTPEIVSFPSAAADQYAIGGELFPAPSGPGVVLLPDVHGISPLYRSLGSRLAEAGFSCLVLDLYRREGAPRLSDPAEVFAWIAGLPDDRVLGDVAAALAYVDARVTDRPARTGLLGFCLGGQYSLMAACRRPPPSACVSFYGMLRYEQTSANKPTSPLDMTPSLGCPLLGLFGEEDALIPPGDVEELRLRLGENGKDFECVTYPGAGHAFLNEARPEAFRPEAAADAWERALRFFDQHLRPDRSN